MRNDASVVRSQIESLVRDEKDVTPRPTFLQEAGYIGTQAAHGLTAAQRQRQGQVGWRRRHASSSPPQGSFTSGTRTGPLPPSSTTKGLRLKCKELSSTLFSTTWVMRKEAGAWIGRMRCRPASKWMGRGDASRLRGLGAGASV